MTQQGQPEHGDLVREAARLLAGEGWTVKAVRHDAAAPWHVAAQRGSRWRVVQVQPPATGPHERLASVVRLGEAAQIPTKLGIMELWYAHVRPGGGLTFGHNVLSGSAWGRDENGTHLRERLGIDTPAASAT